MEDLAAMLIGEFLLWLVRGAGLAVALAPLAVWLRAQGVLH